MGATHFAVALAIGAALLAGWLDLRFAKGRPASLTRRVGHTAAAYAVLLAATDVSRYLTGSAASAEQRLSVVFILVLPALVYAFLAGLWLMRTLAEVARLSRH
jgi:hypothetical protein